LRPHPHLASDEQIGSSASSPASGGVRRRCRGRGRPRSVARRDRCASCSCAPPVLRSAVDGIGANSGSWIQFRRGGFGRLRTWKEALRPSFCTLLLVVQLPCVHASSDSCCARYDSAVRSIVVQLCFQYMMNGIWLWTVRQMFPVGLCEALIRG